MKDLSCSGFDSKRFEHLLAEELAPKKLGWFHIGH
jgi:hypothetical protein